MSIKIKICGLTRREDVEAAVKAGAEYLGFIFYPKSPRFVTPETASEISGELPDNVKKVGVFVNSDLEDVRDIIEECSLDVVQLHGFESAEYVRELHDVEVWKTVNLGNEEDLQEALRFPADAILVDSMTQAQRGGTGKLCDWRLAAQLSKKCRVVLAGGINPENIAEAATRVKPAIIDVNSGVEIAPGIKDKRKIEIIGKIKL
jgi:phosphoribosylanthranilate isomerase